MVRSEATDPIMSVAVSIMRVPEATTRLWHRGTAPTRSTLNVTRNIGLADNQIRKHIVEVFFGVGRQRSTSSTESFNLWRISLTKRRAR